MLRDCLATAIVVPAPGRLDVSGQTVNVVRTPEEIAD
jgi:hypothetical protein